MLIEPSGTRPVRRPTRAPTGVAAAPLSRRRMYRLLLDRGDVLPFLPAPLIATGVAVGAVFGRNWVLFAATVLGVVFGGLARLRELRAGHGLRVSTRNQPELVELVADTARQLGVRAPDRVWLTGEPNSTALSSRFPWRREEIWLGLPTVSAMTGPELRATVAHELAHLRSVGTRPDWLRRRLVDRLLAERRVAAQEWEDLSERARRRRRARRLERFLTETRALAHAEELRADAAATRVVEPDVAAGALVREYAVAGRFTGYLLRCVTPLVETGRYPSQLHSGWLAWCDTPAFWPEELIASAAADTDTLTDEHPSLSARIDAYGATDPAVELRVPHPGSVLRPLGAGDEAALSRHHAVRSGFAPRFRWRRLRPVHWADVPEGAYDSCDSWLRESLVTAAAGLLGRPARDRDVFDLIVRGRRPALQPALMSCLAEHAEDAVMAGASADVPDASLLAVLMYPRLRSRGYRAADPVARHLLTGPDGDLLDLAETSAAVLADPAEFARLRRWLFDEGERRR